MPTEIMLFIYKLKLVLANVCKERTECEKSFRYCTTENLYVFVSGSTIHSEYNKKSWTQKSMSHSTAQVYACWAIKHTLPPSSCRVIITNSSREKWPFQLSRSVFLN